MWRNPYESMGSFSCLGPSPSSIAGLLGAAMGFASPRSQGAKGTDAKHLNMLAKKGLPWPVSEELLCWEKENDYHVACRWSGGVPLRLPWNVNGWKEIRLGDNLRMQQQVIQNPSYEVAVRLISTVAESLVQALKSPAFPVCLGASFCRAILTDIRIQDTLPQETTWAYYKEKFVFGEATPLFCHVVNAEETFERIHSCGYLIYPTPMLPGELQSDPLVKGYCIL